jgi:hypothetical protein
VADDPAHDQPELARRLHRAEVTRNSGLQPSRGVAGARGAEAAAQAAGGGGLEPVSAPAQRPLGAVPATPPSTPPPRGSLLDPRV